jgi:integrase
MSATATRTGRRLDRHAALKAVRRLARTAGIAHTVSPHSLRHGFVTAARRWCAAQRRAGRSRIRRPAHYPTL